MTDSVHPTATDGGDAGELVEAPKLWCVHVRGPDELYACADRGSALEHANELNLYFGRLNDAPDASAYDPIMRAVAVEWPYSAELHATDLIRQNALEAERQERIRASSTSAALPAADGGLQGEAA